VDPRTSRRLGRSDDDQRHRLVGERRAVRRGGLQISGMAQYYSALPSTSRLRHDGSGTAGRPCERRVHPRNAGVGDRLSWREPARERAVKVKGALVERRRWKPINWSTAAMISPEWEHSDRAPTSPSHRPHSADHRRRRSRSVRWRFV
jgi:hypothetical protein